MRQTIGRHAGEIVDMPYHVAVRAVASGTAAHLEDPVPVPVPVAPHAPAEASIVAQGERQKAKPHWKSHKR